MKGFALDENGDILMSNGEIQMINGKDLALQTVKSILSTNKGEWTFNEDEGIDFHNILGKGKTEADIRDEIEEGLKQVDENYEIDTFECSQNGREVSVKFTFNEGEVETTWA